MHVLSFVCAFVPVCDCVCVRAGVRLFIHSVRSVTDQSLLVVHIVTFELKETIRMLLFIADQFNHMISCNGRLYVN